VKQVTRGGVTLTRNVGTDQETHWYAVGVLGLLTLAVTEAAGMAYCSTRRELWQARWPSETAAGDRQR